MATLNNALGAIRPEATDPVREAARRLARALPKREDCTVLVDFLEDDLREGLSAVADVEAHLANVLDVVGSEHPSPIALIEASDDLETLRRLEYLLVVVAQLRRRLSVAAGKLRDR
jgi:hypothetical protein